MLIKVIGFDSVTRILDVCNAAHAEDYDCNRNRFRAIWSPKSRSSSQNYPIIGHTYSMTPVYNWVRDYENVILSHGEVNDPQPIEERYNYRLKKAYK